MNADGTADLIQVRFDAVDVWLNHNGVGWSADRYIIDGTPEHPGFVNRVRLADMNGSGSSDIVWGDARAYRYLDLTGGVQPRLLRVVHNGLGAETTVFYRPSTDFMVDDDLAGRPWETTTPMPVQVVSGVVTSDGLGWYGETEYEYRDPVYDGLEGEFRGFTRALARSIGDENTPTAVAVSRFHAGERPEWLCPAGMSRQECSLEDNPYEALKGATLSSETRSDDGYDGDPWDATGPAYLQTAHSSFAVDRLYEGRDGRGVWFSWASQTDTYLYRNDEFEPGGSVDAGVPLVEVRSSAPDEAGPSSINAETEDVALRSSSDRIAHARITREVDRFGRVVLESAEGFVDESGDEVVEHTAWGHNPAAWIHRACESSIDGPGGEEDPERLGHTQTFYDNNDDALCAVGARGLATFTQVELVSRAIDGGVLAPVWLPQDRNVYDGQGLLVETWAGALPSDLGNALRHARRAYDTEYGTFVVNESIQANRADQEPYFLTVEAAWDSGLGALTSLTDFNDQMSFVIYDALGRQRALFRPLCLEPSVMFEYVVDPAGSLHNAHTLSNEICDRVGSHREVPSFESNPIDASSGVLDAYAFVDGMGRARASIAEGEPLDGFGWVLSDVAEYDARGNARLAYQPMPLPVGSDPVVSVELVDLGVPAAESRYDAFGRVIRAWTPDGLDALATEYGARWTTVWDANDLDRSSPHRGTPTTSVVDGQGRTSAALSRLGDGTVLLARTTYDALGNVLTIARGEATEPDDDPAGASFVSGRTTSRELRHDSLGRRTHNLDPDAGRFLYYYDRLGDLVRSVDARGIENRYVYDLAGRLVAEDNGSDGTPLWASPDEYIAGHSPDDDPDLPLLTSLTAALWSYDLDMNRDFEPEAGADVLYGFDSAYVHDASLCCSASRCLTVRGSRSLAVEHPESFSSVLLALSP